MFLGIDYEVWWFLVVGALFSGYAILDGFDFGAGAWHLFFDYDKERRIALNAIGPVWDGNEVWLVIGGGALFAGFPNFYATFFSSLYIPFMLFLAFLIFRAVSIEFRSKEPGVLWRKSWDTAYCISSIMLAFLLGVVLGNVLIGVEVGADFLYLGDGFLDFFNFYSILVGLTSLSLFMMHGALYLLLKTEDLLYKKIMGLLKYGIIAFVLFYSLSTLYTLIYIPHLSDAIKQSPILFSVPTLTILSVANIPRLASKKKFLSAFFFSSVTISLLLVLVAVEIYPNLLFSSVSSEYNLDIYNSASSKKSLSNMLLMAAVGMPIVASYTFFVYRTFWGKVKIEKTSY